MSQNWLRSYLSDRKQCVQIEHLNSSREVEIIRSDKRTTNCSIPQGSVLGCTLFLAYINCLPKVSDSVYSVLFADDVSLLFKCPNNESLDKITSTFNEIKNWLSKNNLEINNDKTSIIQFRPYQKAPLNLSLLSKNIQSKEVNTCLLLGFNIDSYINWKSHVDKLKNKFAQFIYALSVLKRNTDERCALSTYYAYAYSWLRYGVNLWGHSTDANDLFIQQKKCIRIIYNVRQRESCRPLFLKHKILNFPSIYIFETAKVRKHIHLYEFTKSARRKDMLLLPAPRLQLYKSSPYYSSIVIYNKLPIKIRCVEKDESFNKQLKSLLLQKSYYSIDDYLNDRFTN